MKYAIISELHWDRFTDEWKHFSILTENLSKEQILALKQAYTQFLEESKTKPLFDISIKVEGFECEFSGEEIFEYAQGKIIPMWTLENFE